ncbi:unnamed protein product, partial [Mesorhabditis spiculigera]
MSSLPDCQIGQAYSRLRQRPLRDALLERNLRKNYDELYERPSSCSPGGSCRLRARSPIRVICPIVTKTLVLTACLRIPLAFGLLATIIYRTAAIFQMSIQHWPAIILELLLSLVTTYWFIFTLILSYSHTYGRRMRVKQVTCFLESAKMAVHTYVALAGSLICYTTLRGFSRVRYGPYENSPIDLDIIYDALFYTFLTSTNLSILLAFILATNRALNPWKTVIVGRELLRSLIAGFICFIVYDCAVTALPYQELWDGLPYLVPQLIPLALLAITVRTIFFSEAPLKALE